MKKILVFFVVFTTCFVFAKAAPEANPTVRVGLYYNNSALPTANLQNVTGFGYGYRFGFFDSNHTFIQQFSTDATNRISMLKDKNIYFYDGAFYESGAPSGSILIGAYHIELESSYNSESEVKSAVAKLQTQNIPAFAAYNNKLYKIRIGSYGTTTAAKNDIAKYADLGTATVVGNNSKCVTVVNTVNGKILFEYDNSTSLAVYPSLGEVEKPLTWFKGYKYYGGFQYIRTDGNMAVINFVPMQEYTKGVIPYEMSASWPIEALKAQALCAKTYALYNYGKPSASFDVCATTDCQVYKGANSATEHSDRAVDETYGMYILYDGKPINAVFCSSNGGATENSENVWSAKLPYLRGVYDNNENLDSSTNGRWSYEYTSDELTHILNAKGYSCKKIVNMYIKEFTEMGNVKTLTLVDSSGKEFNFSKEKSRTILYSSTYKKYTHSQRYTVTRKGGGTSSGTTALFINNSENSADITDSTLYVVGADGTKQLPSNNVTVISSNGKTEYGSTGTASGGDPVFVVSGSGWGHNVGMSQYGAKAMANNGKTVADIIHFYYTDVTIYPVE